MIDLNGLRGYRNGIYLCSCWVPGPRSGYCDWPPSTMATRLMILWTITTWTLTRRARVGHEFGYGIADRVGGQRGGDTGGAGSKTIFAARYIEIAHCVGANRANHGGVVEHGHSVIALADHDRVEDVKDALRMGRFGMRW